MSAMGANHVAARIHKPQQEECCGDAVNQFVNDVEVNGVVAAVGNMLSAVITPSESNPDTRELAARTGDAADAAVEAVFDGVEGAAQTTQDVAGTVQLAAAGATVATGGLAAPVAAPVSGAAEVVADGALAVEVGADYLRDGVIDATTGDIISRAVLRTTGNRAKGTLSETMAGSAEGKSIWDATVDMYSSAVQTLFGD